MSQRAYCHARPCIAPGDISSGGGILKLNGAGEIKLTTPIPAAKLDPYLNL